MPYSSFQDLLAVLLGSSWCVDIRGCVFWFGSSKRKPSLGNIAWDKTGFLKKQNDLSTRDFDTYRISNASLSISCVRDTAAKSGFLATISHKVKFSKDLVLKSEGIISQIGAHICRGALSMTCSQSCCSLHFCWQTGMCTHDSGHQSFSLLWATLHAIRRLNNELAHKILTLSYQRCQSCISCVRVCVCQLCGMWVWLAIRLSRVRSSPPAPF